MKNQIFLVLVICLLGAVCLPVRGQGLVPKGRSQLQARIAPSKDVALATKSLPSTHENSWLSLPAPFNALGEHLGKLLGPFFSLLHRAQSRDLLTHMANEGVHVPRVAAHAFVLSGLVRRLPRFILTQLDALSLGRLGQLLSLDSLPMLWDTVGAGLLHDQGAGGLLTLLAQYGRPEWFTALTQGNAKELLMEAFHPRNLHMDQIGRKIHELHQRKGAAGLSDMVTTLGPLGALVTQLGTLPVLLLVWPVAKGLIRLVMSVLELDLPIAGLKAELLEAAAQGGFHPAKQSAVTLLDGLCFLAVLTLELLLDEKGETITRSDLTKVVRDTLHGDLPHDEQDARSDIWLSGPEIRQLAASKPAYSQTGAFLGEGASATLASKVRILFSIIEGVSDLIWRDLDGEIAASSKGSQSDALSIARWLPGKSLQAAIRLLMEGISLMVSFPMQLVPSEHNPFAFKASERPLRMGSSAHAFAMVAWLFGLSRILVELSTLWIGSKTASAEPFSADTLLAWLGLQEQWMASVAGHMTRSTRNAPLQENALGDESRPIGTPVGQMSHPKLVHSLAGLATRPGTPFYGRAISPLHLLRGGSGQGLHQPTAASSMAYTAMADLWSLMPKNIAELAHSEAIAYVDTLLGWVGWKHPVLSSFLKHGEWVDLLARAVSSSDRIDVGSVISAIVKSAS